MDRIITVVDIPAIVGQATTTVPQIIVAAVAVITPPRTFAAMEASVTLERGFPIRQHIQPGTVEEMGREVYDAEDQASGCGNLL